MLEHQRKYSGGKGIKSGYNYNPSIRLKIWVDVLTPKQVLFFQPIAQELMARGHHVIATSRHYREVPPLAESVGFDLQFIGSHGGQSPYGKLKASIERMTALVELVKDSVPECAVSFSSPECARVSFGSNLKHICISDSPHSWIVSRLTIPLSDVLLAPWIIPKSTWTSYGIERRKIVQYRALDPAVWLKRTRLVNVDALRNEIDQSKPTVLVRLEESYATYLRSYNMSWTIRLLNELSSFSECNIIVLCRYDPQLDHIKEKYGSKYIIPTNVVDGAALISLSDVFIGMGGTMTTEAALLGVPTISAYPGRSIFTEKYLIGKGLLSRPQSIRGIVKVAKRFLKDRRRRSWLEKKAKRILGEMEDPVPKIISTIEN